MARKLLKQEVGPKRHDHIYQVDFEKVGAFIQDCLSLINITSVESLDLSKSWLREKRKDISVNEVLDIIYGSDFKHFSFILRNGYEVHKFGEQYWEFCASGTKGLVEYFLWIEIKEESGYKLIEKYKLKKNNE